MKKIIFLMLVFFIVFIIYYFNVNKNIYYFSVGDYLSYGINNLNDTKNGYNDNINKYYKKNISNYLNYSTTSDYRVMDLINDITYNKTIKYNSKEYKIQNILIKANFITISIGMNDIINKKNISYDYVDSLIDEINNLFKLIRKYNKDKIYFLSFYNIINKKNIIEYTNNKLKTICKKNNINFVDISKLNNYMIDITYPTNEGYMYITNQIINFTKN